MLRWRIAILVSAAIAISYLDRQTLPVAIKAIGQDIPMLFTPAVVLCLAMIWPMLVPLGIKLGMGERGDEMLGRFRDWMGTHQTAINSSVLAFFGGVLVAKGIAGL